MAEQIELPTWIAWFVALGGIPSALAAWAGLILTIKRGRTSLKFALKADTYMDGDCDNPGPEFSAIGVTVTNQDMSPITIQQYVCEYSFIDRNGGTRSTQGKAWVDEKLSQGEKNFKCIPVSGKAVKISSLSAIDSTGKQWTPSRRIFKAFRKQAHLYFSSQASD